MNKLRNWVFHHAQYRASIALWIILLMVIAIRHHIIKSHKPLPSPMSHSLIQLIDSLENINKESIPCDSLDSSKDSLSSDWHKSTNKLGYDLIPVNNIDTLYQHPLLRPDMIKRMVKYRSLLGGFYSSNQVQEVYGISPSWFKKVKPYLRVDTLGIKKLSLNTGTFQEINKHPYISYEETQLICRARKNKELKEQDLKILLDSELYCKIAPYICYP